MTTQSSLCVRPLPDAAVGHRLLGRDCGVKPLRTAAALRTVAAPMTHWLGFADGRAALALADAANESLRTGRTVTLN